MRPENPGIGIIPR